MLVFQTRMGKMPGKLQFRWTRPFWIMREFKGSYQLGTLAGEVLDKWINGFRLKPYKAPMPENPFKQLEEQQVPETGALPSTTKPVQSGTKE